jgi:hypothetical protein
VWTALTARAADQIGRDLRGRPGGDKSSIVNWWIIGIGSGGPFDRRVFLIADRREGATRFAPRRGPFAIH